jgi:hypothetical protein
MPTKDRRKPTNGKADPTSNVLDLVEAASKRTDDIANLRAYYEEKLDTLRQSYYEKLTEKESKRVDSNRAFDVAAVNTAYERATQQAATLAAQLSSTTDAFRGLVASTGETLAAQIKQGHEALIVRILELEKGAYVGTGKAEVTDPLLHQIFEEVKLIKESNERSSGKSAGSSVMWGYIIGGIGALFGLASFIALLVHMITSTAGVH